MREPAKMCPFNLRSQVTKKIDVSLMSHRSFPLHDRNVILLNVKQNIRDFNISSSQFSYGGMLRISDKSSLVKLQTAGIPFLDSREGE